VKLYWRMAWRNIWRQKRRSAITIGALALAVALMIFFVAMTVSYIGQMQDNVTSLTLGDLQVHHPSYLADQNLHQLVEGADQLLAVLQERDFAASARCFGYGLLSSDRSGKSAGVRLQGISLQDEATVTWLHQDKYFFKGRYLTAGTRSYLPPVEEAEETGFDDPLADWGIEEGAAQEPLQVGEMVLGKKLATSLGVAPGDTVNVVTMAADGAIGNEIFDVVGVLKNYSEVEDRSLGLITARDYQRLFSLAAGEVHEIAIKVPDGMTLDQGKAVVAELIGDAGVAQTWKEIVPAQAEMMELSNKMMPIFAMIMYIGAGLLIMNAMLMMVFERIREFGVMKAIGFKGRQLISLIYVETFAVCLIAALVGTIGGVAISLWIGYHGLDLSTFAPEGFAFSGTVFDPVLYAELSSEALTIPLVNLFVIAFLSVLYPAIKAAVIEPVKAIYYI
jgi:ABC-type lipoprotein release transport system permease subunit